MLTSGWRSASSLVISRWEEVTVPISYKRFSANCLYYVQLSARMKEDVFPTRRACLETEGRVKVVIFHSVASNEIEKLYQSILPLWNGIKKKKTNISPKNYTKRNQRFWTILFKKWNSKRQKTFSSLFQSDNIIKLCTNRETWLYSMIINISWFRASFVSPDKKKGE